MYAGGSGLRDWFCLLRCIVGVHIHCTTFIVPSFVYWSALLELYIVRRLLCPVVSTHVYSAGVLRFTSKRFLCDIYYWILSTMSSAWDNTYNATIQKHKKINSIKNDHFSPVGDNTSEIDGGSAVNVQVRRTLDPNVRNWGRKVSGFLLKSFRFFRFFSSQNATGSKQVELGRDNLWVLISFRFYLKDSF